MIKSANTRRGEHRADYGFANSVVSPAMEFRREGLVMGVGAKMFTLAGPVLVYGIGSSVLVGLIVLLLGMGG